MIIGTTTCDDAGMLHAMLEYKTGVHELNSQKTMECICIAVTDEQKVPTKRWER